MPSLPFMLILCWKHGDPSGSFCVGKDWALLYGGFVAILFSVCNHLGDLPGVGFAKRQLRKLLFYPVIYGVPKWYTTVPPSYRKPQGRIGQVVNTFFAV